MESDDSSVRAFLRTPGIQQLLNDQAKDIRSLRLRDLVLAGVVGRPVRLHMAMPEDAYADVDIKDFKKSDCTPMSSVPEDVISYVRHFKAQNGTVILFYAGNTLCMDVHEGVELLE